MEFFHHPAFQSLVLPALLAGAGVGVLRVMLGATAGVRWAPAAAVLALLLALALLPGFAWPPRAAAQKLPWIILAAWLLALVLEALHAGRWLHALAGSALWIGAGWWLQEAASTTPQGLAAAVTGIAVLIALTTSTWRPQGASRAVTNAWPASNDNSAGGGAAGAAMLAVAALGLAALAVGAGSLLLAQLAVMLAAVTAGLGLWLWPRPRVGFGPVVAMPLGIAWLVIAQAALLLTTLSPAVLAVLALAFAAAPLLARVRLPGRRAWVEPCAVALLAALPAALAVTWQITAGPGADTPGAADPVDPYYEPRWR